MKVLFLSQRVPYPPNRGDTISTWRLVERFGRRFDVEIVAFAHDEADDRGAADLRELGYSVTTVRHRPKWDRMRSLPLLATKTPLTLGVYGSRELQAIVDEKIRDCAMVYGFSSSMGAFVMKHRQLPRAMHFAELDSDKWRQYAEKKSFPASWVYRREWKTLWDFEKRLAAEMDENVFCTPLEKEIFEKLIPGPSSMVIRNGVDLQKLSPGDPSEIEPGHLVFVGVMNYYPNVEGCLWFVREILPRIRERVPGARFSIVGAHPTPEIERLAQEPGVAVTGFVDDPADWLRKADVSVAPLRIARGIQNKVLEAMSMGLPVVGTTSATQGVEGTPGTDFLVADDVPTQVSSICELLENNERARALGRQARRFVEEKYDWEVTLQPLDELTDRLLQQKATTA